MGTLNDIELMNQLIKREDLKGATLSIGTAPIFREFQYLNVEKNRDIIRQIDTQIFDGAIEGLRITTTEKDFKYPKQLQIILGILSKIFNVTGKDTTAIRLQELTNLLDGKTEYAEVTPKRMEEVKEFLLMLNATNFTLNCQNTKTMLENSNQKKARERGGNMIAEYRGSILPCHYLKLNNGEEFFIFNERPILLNYMEDTKYLQSVKISEFDVTRKKDINGKTISTGLHSTDFNTVVTNYFITDIKNTLMRKNLTYIEITFTKILEHVQKCGIKVTNPNRAKDTIIKLAEDSIGRDTFQKMEIIGKGRTQKYKIRFYKKIDNL